MSAELSQTVIIIFAGTTLILLLLIFIFGFFYVFQKRKTRFENEKNLINAKFKEEINLIQSEIKEETMQFISQELHDNISQTLLITNIILNNMQEQSEDVTNAKNSLQQSIDQVRLLSKALNTENVLHNGILKSFEFEIFRLKQLNRWKIDYFNEVNDIKINADKQLILFRIFQELINNLIKYSQAKNIVIEFIETAEYYNLNLIDDGNQYDLEQQLGQNDFNKGTGLKGVLKRIKLLNGHLLIVPNKSKGMTVNIKIPKEN